MAKAKSEKIVFYGTGRRKSSVARVRLVEGTGKITINGKDIDEYTFICYNEANEGKENAFVNF